MSKKKTFSIILLAVILSLLVNVSVGRWLTAEISTWPLLNKWKLLSPQAPIVITERDTVRVSDGTDLIATIGAIKSKISSVVLVNGSSETVAGAAINLTSDGSFVTGTATFSGKAPGDYYVVLNDGSQAKISQKTPDPATSLVFFKAALSSVPVPALGSSQDLEVGQQIVFAQSSLQSFNVRTALSAVSAAQSDVEGLVFQSDFPSRTFSASVSQALTPGTAIVNSNGEIVGLWSGSQIISADVLNTAQALYFNNQQSIVRPSFGFSYSVMTATDAKLTGLPQGVLVKAVLPGSSAQKAGLVPGDVITQIDSQNISETSPLEGLLEKYKPGDKPQLNIVRNKQSLSVTLTVNTLPSK